MQITTHKLTNLRKFSSPPQTANTNSAPGDTAPTDTISFSEAAASKDKKGLSTLQAVGLGVGLTVAVGGAFIAGAQFGQPEEVTFETQVEDAERDFSRGWEDFTTDLRRAGEDFQTEFNRGWDDAQTPPSQKELRRRQREDAKRETEREVQDVKKDFGRKASDFWRKLTD